MSSENSVNESGAMSTLKEDRETLPSDQTGLEEGLLHQNFIYLLTRTPLTGGASARVGHHSPHRSRAIVSFFFDHVSLSRFLSIHAHTHNVHGPTQNHTLQYMHMHKYGLRPTPVTRRAHPVAAEVGVGRWTFRQRSGSE